MPRVAVRFMFQLLRKVRSENACYGAFWAHVYSDVRRRARGIATSCRLNRAQVVIARIVGVMLTFISCLEVYCDKLIAFYVEEVEFV